MCVCVCVCVCVCGNCQFANCHLSPFLLHNLSPFPFQLDILLNGSPVDVLSAVVHRASAYEVGRATCQRLQGVIHRQLYEVAIQATVGSKVIARET